MNDDDIIRPFGAVLSGLLYNGDHSDLTLVSSDGHEFHVHVAILHCGSLYFRTAMKQKWKETENKRFELDDDSVTLKAILEYIYSQGQCYSVPVTCSQQLEQHAAIYFAADFYGISDLKKFSQRQFLGLVERKPEGWDKAMKAWPTVVRAMYEHDAPTTTSLKNEILRLTWDHLAALEEEQGFQGLLDEVPAFSSDMFKLARARRVRENLCDFIRSTCGSCLHSINVAVKGREYLHCPVCSTRNSCSGLKDRRVS